MAGVLGTGREDEEINKMKPELEGDILSSSVGIAPSVSSHDGEWFLPGG